MDQIYSFYKTNLRSAHRAAGEYITNFTFFVIDEECVRAKPRQGLLCSDAPDRRENNDGAANKELKLKTMRLPLEKTMSTSSPWNSCPRHRARSKILAAR